jgi:hypothetical protein
VGPHPLLPPASGGRQLLWGAGHRRVNLFAPGPAGRDDWQHILYGIFALVFLPGLFTYLQGDDSNRAQWVYALGALFLFGIALRSITTGI